MCLQRKRKRKAECVKREKKGQKPNLQLAGKIKEFRKGSVGDPKILIVGGVDIEAETPPPPIAMLIKFLLGPEELGESVFSS